MNQHIYMINCKNKSVGITSMNKHYVIGFKNASIARNVMYSMHPEKKPYMLANEPNLFTDEKTKAELMIDNKATLFIPKYNSADPASTYLQETGYYIHTVKYEDFVVYPVTHALGVIIPYVLLNEELDEFMYRSHVIDPQMNLHLSEN